MVTELGRNFNAIMLGSNWQRKEVDPIKPRVFDALGRLRGL